MSNILFANDEESVAKIDIDGLYERNMNRELRNVSIFNKIINRIHKRILTTSKSKQDKYIWFTIPKFIFGQPLYHQGDCIAYIITKLSDNGFFVKYMHPNTIFLSWEQWIPSYVRLEYKKKTGIIINEKGEVLNSPEKAEEEEQMSKSALESTTITGIKEQKNYTPISKYKPTGHLVYNPDVFQAISGK